MVENASISISIFQIQMFKLSCFRYLGWVFWSDDILVPNILQNYFLLQTKGKGLSSEYHLTGIDYRHVGVLMCLHTYCTQEGLYESGSSGRGRYCLIPPSLPHPSLSYLRSILRHEMKYFYWTSYAHQIFIDSLELVQHSTAMPDTWQSVLNLIHLK